ncbi:MAG: hypothetical protein AB1505_16100 [Candidatus Latescibacterota bacterium]
MTEDVRAVFFDADGTLIGGGAWRCWVARTVETLARRCAGIAVGLLEGPTAPA